MQNVLLNRVATIVSGLIVGGALAAGCLASAGCASAPPPVPRVLPLPPEPRCPFADMNYKCPALMQLDADDRQLIINLVGGKVIPKLPR